MTATRFYPYANLIRAVAILLVIIDHCLAAFAPDCISPETKHFLFAGDATLFFTLSGALLIPVEPGNIGGFLWRRFVKVCIPFIIWLVIYHIIDIRESGADATEAYKMTKNLLARPSFPEGWFFYVLIGLYAAIPVLSVFIRNASRRMMEYFLAVWLVSVSFPLMKYIGVHGFSPTDSPAGTFFNYSGYLVLGYYLRLYPIYRLRKNIFILVAIILAAGISLPVIMDARVKLHGIRILAEELSPSTICWTAAAYTILQYMAEKRPRLGTNTAVTFVSKISFSAYLCQHLVIFIWLAPIFPALNIPLTGQTAIAVPATLLFAWICNLPLSRLIKLT